MTISHCKNCEAMLFDGGMTLMGNPHVCPPIFEVLAEHYLGDWSQADFVHSYDYDDAATKFAQHYDEACAEGPSEQTLYVRKRGCHIIRKFEISFEYSVDYHAYEKECVSEPQQEQATA